MPGDVSTSPAIGVLLSMVSLSVAGTQATSPWAVFAGLPLTAAEQIHAGAAAALVTALRSPHHGGDGFPNPALAAFPPCPCPATSRCLLPAPAEPLIHPQQLRIADHGSGCWS